MTQEKSEFARNVRELEADLSRVRKDAERFGNDLKALRRERDKLEEKKKVEEERARKAEGGQSQLKAELRLIKEELEGEKGRSRKALVGWESHVCVAGCALRVVLWLGCADPQEQGRWTGSRPKEPAQARV